MNRTSRLQAPHRTVETIVTVKISDFMEDTPAPSSRKCHRRNHTRRLFVQKIEPDLASPKAASYPRKQVVSSPEYTDLNSFPSTTIESEGSWSEGTIRQLASERTTVSIPPSEAAGSIAGFLSELKANMNEMMKEDNTRAELRREKRVSVKTYLLKLLKQRSTSCFVYSNSSDCEPKLMSPSLRRVQRPSGRVFKY
mmetsp:Transcript_333/g.383  ORF Transcript_333/g.383 Transcript_333/m.383 type:complete len:196 (-) Transcript_333:37-624(-)